MSTRTQLICLALIALAMAAVQWYTRRPAAKPVSAATAQYFAYCPTCGLEMTCQPQQAVDPPACPHCGRDRKMEVNTYSRNNGDQPSMPVNRYLLASAFGVPTALAVGVYFLGRRGNEQLAPEEDEEECRFKCPGCGHGMTSTTYRRGSTAVCPVCAELFVVTGLDDRETPDRNWEESRELEDRVRSSLRKKPKTKRSKRRGRKGESGG